MSQRRHHRLGYRLGYRRRRLRRLRCRRPWMIFFCPPCCSCCFVAEPASAFFKCRNRSNSLFLTFLVKCSHIGITNRKTLHAMRNRSIIKNAFFGDSLFKANSIVGYCKTADRIAQTPTPIPNILPNIPGPNTCWQYTVIVV